MRRAAAVLPVLGALLCAGVSAAQLRASHALPLEQSPVVWI